MNLAPPVPDNEAERLQRLHDLMVLDTDREPVFDHLVRLASQVCGAPIALLSLVDEGRQWFKAAEGLPGVSETPRNQAFCAHAILDDAPLEIADATMDERFRANPLVTGDPHIRFYAGAPLILATGERIGTLCVIDRTPRSLDPAQRSLLQSLARIATDTLVMRRDLILRALSARSAYEQAVAASEAQHRAIVEAQSELISLARADGALLYVNPAYARHFGRTPAELVDGSLYDFVEPADRRIVSERVAWVLATGEVLTSENRMTTAAGAETWVAWTNSAHRQADGSTVLRSVGRDVSARKRAEQALRSSQAFLQRTGQVAGVGGWELVLRTGAVTWSDETRRIHEVAADFEPTLDSAIQFYPPQARPIIEDAVRMGMETGQGWDLELPFVTARGRAIWVRAVGEVEFEGGQAVRLFGALQDITARKALERQLADNERFVRQITDSLPVRIAYVDRERRYRFVNRAYCERFQRNRAHILGRTLEEIIQADAPGDATARINAVLAGRAQHFEFEEVLDDDRRRIETRLIPDGDAGDAVQGFFVTGIDITQRADAEHALRVLTTILEVSTDFIVQADPRGAVLYMNPAARRIAGLGADAPLAGLQVADFNTDETNRLFAQTIVPAVKATGFWQGETTIVAAGGQRLPVSHLVIGHRGDDGRLERYSAVMRDISAEVVARQESARQTATLRSVTEALPVIVCSLDRSLRYRFVNPAFERWHGVLRDQVVGHTAHRLLAGEDMTRSRPLAERALAGETVQFEHQCMDRPGQPTLAISYTPVRLDDGAVDGFIGVAVDITPHRQEQVRLQALAERDPLTGLLNRAGFEARMGHVLDQGGGPALALLYIDLDHFKPVNDAHGHAVGDRLLQCFADRVLGLVRPTDAVARLGGDEFAVLLPGVRRLDDAQAVAGKVLRAAQTPFEIDALRLTIGASVGLAMGTAREDGAQDLLARADAQLYRAKQAGRGGVAGEPARPA